jgi:hypothetical protein
MPNQWCGQIEVKEVQLCVWILDEEALKSGLLYPISGVDKLGLRRCSCVSGSLKKKP